MNAIDVGGLFNVRASGIDAPWLLRSGAVDDLTPTGVERLRKLGVSVIVDLREPQEAIRAAHGIRVASVPIYDAEPPRIGRLEDIYAALIRDRGHALARAVAEIADAERAALVHCTAGKDRTGLVVALALLAAGADPADVVADYALSGRDVRPVREHVAREIAAAAPAELRQETLRLHLDSPPDAMRQLLHHVAELGGAAAYLRAHGLTDDQLDALRTKHGSAG
ncbi:hypothetical protein GCM10010915_04040 [Microbacterium faecale]|uniref:Tyrosine specific protein phosphatases domain-containing protein n=1 Tax=Microbacterium faecale TaxID=1804630 RepID=A0A917DCP4_9MICO|nr:tyrosine-protein phosphatase [Microbacterium faecale]GGD27163.1 hypothetical protein GCM10010915_04040 [Microbacterium faecale]